MENVVKQLETRTRAVGVGVRWLTTAKEGDEMD